ncbi:MAG: hypothetical protein FWE44_01290 [Defluviitaleaceae bacterium]|nr:hypothetical protein [Defluviitaleaceae bacterium]
MNNKKNGLDEMQNQQRNKIGNQMFMVMTILLFINNGLRGFGITWLEYPTNIMLIVTICLSVYLVRLVIANAYLPTNKKSNTIRLVVALVCAIALGISAVFFLGQSTVEVNEPANSYGAIALFVFSAVGLIAVFVTALIKKKSNNDDED